jgi:hypothetical protein
VNDKCRKITFVGKALSVSGTREKKKITFGLGATKIISK